MTISLLWTNPDRDVVACSGPIQSAWFGLWWFARDHYPVAVAGEPVCELLYWLNLFAMLLMQCAFPDYRHAPAEFSQCEDMRTIALCIAVQLRFPEISIRAG